MKKILMRLEGVREDRFIYVETVCHLYAKHHMNYMSYTKSYEWATQNHEYLVSWLTTLPYLEYYWFSGQERKLDYTPTKTIYWLGD